MSSKPRTAIVTGASKGIGAAIARQLATDGFVVVVNYATDTAGAEATVTAIQTAGGRAVSASADVSDPGAMTALFDRAETEFGVVNVLVNNAGISRHGTLAEVSDEEYRKQIEANITGTFNGMREAARRLSDGGRIINLSTSIIGHYSPGNGVYAATKAAVEAMTHIVAKELGSRQITVNAVAPGPIATELLFRGRSEAVIQGLVDATPLGRLGEVEDIARVVSFLAGPDSGWVSGQVIRANGGRN